MTNSIDKLLLRRFVPAALIVMLLVIQAHALEETRSYFPPVLMYHDIKTMPVNEFDVTVEDFAGQLDILKEEGYTTLSLEEFASYIRDGRGFPEKSVLITFDDGYRGIYTHAVPELRKRGMKAAFFIVSDTVSRLDTGYPHVTLEELRAIASDDSFSIGSHTVTHANLSKLTHEERQRELRESKARLEAMTGRKIFALAYPWGDYDSDVISDAKAAGYEFAFAVQDDGLMGEPARFSIPRIYTGLELGRDNHKLFREYLARYNDMPPEAFTDRWKFIPLSYDVIVAGGGTGGSAAAIQASRLGVSVLVVEGTNMLGGQATAAGVSTMDDMSNSETGIYHEFMDRVRAHYRGMKKSISTCYWKDYGKAFEPSVGHRILSDLAKSADVAYYSQILRVDTENRRVTVRTPEWTREIGYNILIDATEYGDILPLANVTYRVGNSVSPAINDTMIQDITWTAIIRKYPRGIPEHLKPKAPLEGYEKARANYRIYVTRKGFDFRGRYPVQMPVNVASHNAYRAVPDSYSPGSYTGAKKDWYRISKCGVNWGNDYPGMYLWHGRYGMPVDYIENPDMRANMEREALLKTLHYIYYMQNELGESWSVDENEYSNDILPEVARDLPEEWQNIVRHMPPIPYVRECRRIVGAYTLNAHDLHVNSTSWHNGEKSHEFTDAIAVGGYNLDLHGGDDDDDIESSLGETQRSIERDKPAGPFQVPLRALIPQSTDNFIAAEKNLSMSRLVSGALRLQPITMMTGQAAGALAALAIKQGVQPRDVKAIHVQKVLGDAGVMMSLCRYTDVNEKNAHYAGIQIATLYGLIDAELYPNFAKGNVNNPGKGGRTKGRFGVNRIISEKELARAIERAEKFTDGRKLSIPEHGRLTKGEAADLVVNAMCESLAHAEPAEHGVEQLISGINSENAQ